MRTFSGKRSTLALAIAGVTAMSGFMAMPEARAEGFIDDSTLTGGIYYWQRERTVKMLPTAINTKPTFLTPPGTPTSIFSPVMLLICSALILPRLRRLKWRKTATALTRTKSRFQKVIKPMTKTGPAIKAV